jgi:hypothetical protein
MSEDFIEENILLAGQISNKEPIFKTIAMMDHENAFAYHLIELIPKIKDLEPVEKVKEIIKLTGQVNFMTGCSELSKLAAIMGDTRRRFSARKLKESLAYVRTNDTETATP